MGFEVKAGTTYNHTPTQKRSLLDMSSAAACAAASGSPPNSPPKLTGQSSAARAKMFKKALTKAAREYFRGFDATEFARRAAEAIRERGDSALNMEVSKILTRISLDQKASARGRLAPLLTHLIETKTLARDDVFDGLYHMSRHIDDIIMDVPSARRMLEVVFAQGPQYGLTARQCARLRTVAINSRVSRAAKSRIERVLREFMSSADTGEVARCFAEMKAPHAGHQLVKIAVSMALDRSARERRLTSALIADLHRAGAVAAKEIEGGFERLLQFAEELCVDVIDAEVLLSGMVQDALRCGALPLQFLDRVHLQETDRGFAVVRRVRAMLASDDVRVSGRGCNGIGEAASGGQQQQQVQGQGGEQRQERTPSMKEVTIVTVDTTEETLQDVLANPEFGKPVAAATPKLSPALSSLPAPPTLSMPPAAQDTNAEDIDVEGKAGVSKSGSNPKPVTAYAASASDSMQKGDKAQGVSARSDTATGVEGNASTEGPSVGPWLAPHKRKTHLEDFTLESVIGRGSYGKVFLVKHVKMQRLFAMKVLRKQELVKRDVVSNIKLERKVLESVDHPFLVGLRYAFQTPAKLYMVMEYVPGGELFRLLAERRELTADQTRFFAAELVCALAHLHSLDIIYRDLKPENVLIRDDGHVALTDFGFAKTEIGRSGKTLSFCGTIDYMAPEVIQKSGHGQGVDWWALGVLLFEMSAGYMPFQGANRKATQDAICSGKLRFPRYFDMYLRSLLQGLLRRNVKKRLGCRLRGVEDIQKQYFFAGIDWAGVPKKVLKPPFVPKIRNAADVSNFDAEFTEEPAVDSDTEHMGSFEAPAFRGFSFDGDVGADRRSDRRSDPSSDGKCADGKGLRTDNTRPIALRRAAVPPVQEALQKASTTKDEKEEGVPVAGNEGEGSLGGSFDG